MQWTCKEIHEARHDGCLTLRVQQWGTGTDSQWMWEIDYWTKRYILAQSMTQRQDKQQYRYFDTAKEAMMSAEKWVEQYGQQAKDIADERLHLRELTPTQREQYLSQKSTA